MKKLTFTILFLASGCDKFQGAALDAKNHWNTVIQSVAVSQAQRDAEAQCAASINSGQPKFDTSGHPINYATVNPPQFQTQVLGYNKYQVTTLLDVPNALGPFIAECTVDQGKIIHLRSD